MERSTFGGFGKEIFFIEFGVGIVITCVGNFIFGEVFSELHYKSIDY